MLISVRAPVGDVNLAANNYCIGRGLAAIIGKDCVDNCFWLNYLMFTKTRPEEKGTGSTFKSINKGVLRDFFIPLPPLPQQREIARILQAVDCRIEAEERHKAALAALFKSLLANLMTGRVRVGGVGAKNFSPLPTWAPPRGTSKTIGSVVRGFKIGVTKWMRGNGVEGPIWQRNYHEHIIRDEDALRRIGEYIQTNPQRWMLDRENPERVGVDEFDTWLDRYCRGTAPPCPHEVKR